MCSFTTLLILYQGLRYSKKRGQQKNEHWPWKRGFRHLCTRVLKVEENQKHPPEVFYNKRCSYKFRKYHRKTSVPESLFQPKCRPEACNFIKKESLPHMFSCEFYKISKNAFFTEHLRTTTSWKYYAEPVSFFIIIISIIIIIIIIIITIIIIIIIVIFIIIIIIIIIVMIITLVVKKAL